MKSIKTKLTVYFTVLLLVVCSSMGVVAYYNSSKAITAQIEEILPEKARDAAKLLSSRIEKQLSEVETIANRNVIKGADVGQEEKKAALAQEAKRLGYIKMGIAAPGGELVFSDNSAANISDREYFQKAMAGTANISDPIVSKQDSSLVIMLAVPIKNDAGQVYAVLTAMMDGQGLVSITDDIKFGKSGFAYVVNSIGTTIAHPNKELVFQQDNDIENAKKDPELKALGALTERMVSGENAFGAYTYNSVTKYMGFAPVEGTGWSVAVAAPERELLSGLNALKISTGMMTLIFIVLAMVATLFIAGKMTKQIKELMAFLNMMAGGDFSVDVPEYALTLKDELGAIAGSVNILQKKLREMVTRIAGTSEELAASSQQLAATTDSTNADMQQVSAAIQTISSGLQEVSASAEEITASSEEMAAALNVLNEEAGKGARVAEETHQKADVLEHEAVASREESEKVYNTIHERITDAMEKAKIVDEIANMADQISGIADQTNLLALNAAIEAARAGDQGRGFAVVAEEVRKLAGDSAETVNHIQKLTTQVQQSINQLIKDSGDLLTYINRDVHADYDKFVNTAKQYGQDANTFFGLTERSAGMSDQVLKIVQEVNAAIVEVANTINHSADESQGIVTGVGNTGEAVEEIDHAAARLSQTASDLKDLVSQYKI